LASFNHVLLIGYLARDPELRYTGSGTAVANFSIGVNKKTGKGDDKKEIVNFFDIEAWEKKAEICSEYLAKGDPVVISGELKQERWTGEDGKQHSRVKVIASNIQFLPKSDGGKDKDSNQDRQPSGDIAPF